MASEHNLTRALRELIHSQRTAALGTLDAQGEVFVSRVPFAIDSANGTWQLRVRDRANGDVGYLDEWSMQF